MRARTAATPPGGVYRTDDGGVTFTQTVALADGTNLARARTREIAISPSAPATVVLVTDAGLFRTTTAGEQWVLLPLPAREVLSVSVHPRNADILVASVISRDPSGRGKMVKSLDGGRTWAEIFTAPAAEQEVGAIFRRRRQITTLLTTVAHDPTSPAVLVAGTNTGTLLGSPDGGIRWQTRQTFQQGITALKFSPALSGRLLIRLADGSLLRSADGGTTVERALVGRGSDQPLGFAPKPEVVHAVAFVPPGEGRAEETIMVGTQAGLYRSADGGVTWEALSLPPTGSAETPVTSLARSPNGTLWAASGFVLFSSSDGGNTWRATSPPLKNQIRFVAADPVNPSRLYLVFEP